MTKYLIDVESFSAEIDAEAIARALVARCARRGSDPLDEVEDAAEDVLAAAVAAYQPDVTTDGGLEEDIREAVIRLVEAEDAR